MTVEVKPKDLMRDLAHAVQDHLDEAIAADTARHDLEAARRAVFPAAEDIEAWAYEREQEVGA